MGAEKQPLLLTDCSKPTTTAQGRAPPRIGNIGHMTRIANKLVELGNNNSIIHTYLQKNNEWADWHANVLLKRNAIENVHQWACGRPNALQDRFRDSDEEDFHNRDYDVAALANNLSQVFQYGNYNNVDNPEADASPERDDEDAYFDDESAEVVISSLRLGDDQDSTSLFTNSNWFAYDEGRSNDQTVDSLSSPSTSTDHSEEIIVGEKEGLVSSALSNQEAAERNQILENGSAEEPQELRHASQCNNDEKPPQWVEWRETSDSSEVLESDPPAASLNCELETVKGQQSLDQTSVGTDPEETEGGSPGSRIVDASVPSKSENEKQCIDPSHEPEASGTDVNAKISDNEDSEPETSNTDINTKIPDNEDGKPEPSNTDGNAKIPDNEDGESLVQLKDAAQSETV
ncbi:serine/threonine-protein phosphatase 6 regulatory subunit 3-like isoform X1 [Iris pallida]|uniref:Serine/threonine-protein phosphatase 6 regulatory subunit 3-like isoform X1 n=1 Tax=Iris pallida TaxID=29817 RepID=A0AAX6GT92_IRIPA|nr:serine/threonine-protein phosphatase 6 regulatory subunit 3-like isoform X1 [Iris pallida]